MTASGIVIFVDNCVIDSDSSEPCGVLVSTEVTVPITPPETWPIYLVNFLNLSKLMLW
jgi:hypothetical protein